MIAWKKYSFVIFFVIAALVVFTINVVLKQAGAYNNLRQVIISRVLQNNVELGENSNIDLIRDHIRENAELSVAGSIDNIKIMADEYFVVNGWSVVFDNPRSRAVVVLADFDKAYFVDSNIYLRSDVDEALKGRGRYVKNGFTVIAKTDKIDDGSYRLFLYYEDLDLYEETDMTALVSKGIISGVRDE